MRVRDIGKSGAYIEAEADWCVGTVVHLVLECERPGQSSPEAVFGLWARIVHADPGGMGVQFIRMEREGLRRFERFLNTALDTSDMKGRQSQEQSAPGQSLNEFTAVVSLLSGAHGAGGGTGAGHGRRGASLIEFALILPLLLILIANVVNFAGFFFAWITVEDAARAGAQFLSRSTVALGDPAPVAPDPASGLAGLVSPVVTTGVSSLVNNPSLALQVCTRNPSGKGSGSATLVVTCTVVTGTFSSAPANPDADPSAEAPNYEMGWVDVAYTYKAFIPIGFKFPALGFGPVWPFTNSVVIQRQVVMRLLQ